MTGLCRLSEHCRSHPRCAGDPDAGAPPGKAKCADVRRGCAQRGLAARHKCRRTGQAAAGNQTDQYTGALMASRRATEPQRWTAAAVLRWGAAGAAPGRRERMCG